jgi:hypothetical protein
MYILHGFIRNLYTQKKTLRKLSLLDDTTSFGSEKISIKGFPARLGNQLFLPANANSYAELSAKIGAFPNWEYSRFYNGDFTPRLRFMRNKKLWMEEVHQEVMKRSRFKAEQIIAILAKLKSGHNDTSMMNLISLS